MGYKKIEIASSDGLKLFVRGYHYGCGEVAEKHDVAVLCLHGFMRTGRDYEDIAAHLSKSHRVVVPDIRGRGESEYAESIEGYLLGPLLDDVWKILDELGINRVVVLGTTLGAIMGLVMARIRPETVAGVIMVDQGAETAAEGVVRMQSHGSAEKMTYEAAVTTIRKQNEEFFPLYKDGDFARMMMNAHKQDKDGFYIRDLDQLCRGATMNLLKDYGKPDLWEDFKGLGNIPCLALRGEFSDYVTEEIFAKMRNAKENCVAVTVPGVGHPPQLNEVESIQAIDRFLSAL